jgi:hypothetical protein
MHLRLILTLLAIWIDFGQCVQSVCHFKILYLWPQTMWHMAYS